LALRDAVLTHVLDGHGDIFLNRVCHPVIARTLDVHYPSIAFANEAVHAADDFEKRAVMQSDLTKVRGALTANILPGLPVVGGHHAVAVFGPERKVRIRSYLAPRDESPVWHAVDTREPIIGLIPAGGHQLANHDPLAHLDIHAALYL